MLWYILWYLAGLIGSYILLIVYRRVDFPPNYNICPSPISLIGISVFAVLGAFGLFAAIVITFIFVCIEKSSLIPDWWFKPLCKKKDVVR